MQLIIEDADTSTQKGMWPADTDTFTFTVTNKANYSLKMIDIVNDFEDKTDLVYPITSTMQEV